MRVVRAYVLRSYAPNDRSGRPCPTAFSTPSRLPVSRPPRRPTARAKGEHEGVDRAFDRFTDAEAAFIAERERFHMASVSENGWPDAQHRGGPSGFLKMLDTRTLAFADFRGNRQYISLGNVAADDRMVLILMDQPNRARLKILARLAVRDLPDAPALAESLALLGCQAVPERAFVL